MTTFVLAKPSKWKKLVKVFLRDPQGATSEFFCDFTTEAVVSKENRKVLGKTVPAEFSTNEPAVMEALYTSSGYGIDFYEKGDPEGLKKKKTIVYSEEDSERSALKSLFDDAGLVYDNSLSIKILKEKYAIHMQSTTGRKVKESQPTPINISPVDVGAEIYDEKKKRREMYEKKFGEPIPDIVKDDVAFLDALPLPGFDAKAYIESKTQSANPDSQPEENYNIHDEYQSLFGEKVPNPKKNDIAWIKAKIEAKKQQ